MRPGAQVELSLTCHQPELVRFCQENKIAVQAYSPLGSTGAGLRDNEVVRKIAAAHKCDPAQVLISWPVRGT
jgi:glycerol 2-dehydrogenase (NADP+)